MCNLLIVNYETRKILYLWRKICRKYFDCGNCRLELNNICSICSSKWFIYWTKKNRVDLSGGIMILFFFSYWTSLSYESRRTEWFNWITEKKFKVVKITTLNLKKRSFLGERENFNRLIVMEEVSGLAERPNNFASFFNCCQEN